MKESFNFKSLDDAILHWKKRFTGKAEERGKRDTVIDYAAKAPNFKTAVKRACDSRRENGKMFPHQSKVTAVARGNFADAIILRAQSIKGIKDFDTLHDRLEMIAKETEGIGPVTTYDVAVRIAAFLKIKITSLYLHAGVRIGLYKLLDRRTPRLLRIPRHQIPKTLTKHLDTDSIEDFLCGYRAHLKPWLKNDKLAWKEKEHERYEPIMVRVMRERYGEPK